jgi:hypothetical protein
MSIQNTTPSPQQRQHWLCEQALTGPAFRSSPSGRRSSWKDSSSPYLRDEDPGLTDEDLDPEWTQFLADVAEVQMQEFSVIRWIVHRSDVREIAAEGVTSGNVELHATLSRIAWKGPARFQTNPSGPPRGSILAPPAEPSPRAASRSGRCTAASTCSW